MGNNCCTNPIAPVQSLGYKGTHSKSTKHIDEQSLSEAPLPDKTHQKKGLTKHTRKGTQINKDIFNYQAEEETPSQTKHTKSVLSLAVSQQSEDLDHGPPSNQAQPCAIEEISVPQIVQFAIDELGELEIPESILKPFAHLPVLPPFELIDKSIYKGQWQNGKRQGYGKQYYPDGSIYEGLWVNDQSEIYGRLIHQDGDVYFGEWSKDMAQGKGTYIHSNGAKYVGQWERDMQHGYGVETWLDAEFSGHYEFGKKHGKGKMMWKNGSYYEGDFVKNEIEGYGEYHWSDGRIYKGQWKAGQMEGEGEFWWADGRHYKGCQAYLSIGQYKGDKKHGQGVMTTSDGKVIEGVWMTGKLVK